MRNPGRWIALALALTGCGSTQHALRPVERTSGATGSFETKTSDNGNTRVTLKVAHMPRPEDIDAGFKTYVLWLRPTGEQDWKNMGALRVDDAREGKLEVATPYPTFDLQVTAEPDSTVAAPGSVVVLAGAPQ
jgi:hypothetical protein